MLQYHVRVLDRDIVSVIFFSMELEPLTWPTKLEHGPTAVVLAVGIFETLCLVAAIGKWEGFGSSTAAV